MTDGSRNTVCDADERTDIWNWTTMNQLTVSKRFSHDLNLEAEMYLKDG